MTIAIALDTYTDTQAMRALLQAWMPGFAEGRLKIEALVVRHARRNTSRGRNPCPLALCYELQVRDTEQGRCGSQLIYAQVFPEDEAATAFAASHSAQLSPPAFGVPMAHLPTLNLLVWASPNDPGLPQLPELLDPAAAGRLLPCGAAGPPSVELLRYEPQQRATLRYRFEGVEDGSARTLYAKTFCDGRGAEVYSRFAYFWELAQQDEQAPLVARPICHHAGTHSCWQAEAPGAPLRHELETGAGAVLLRRAAHALARLHAAPLEPSADAPVHTPDHWIGEVWRRRQKLGRVDARWAERIARVAETIQTRAARVAKRPLSLIHGDFHHDQVWVHEGRIVLFDFDEFTCGDPMEDLATFLLKLELTGASPALRLVFAQAYEAAAPGRFDRLSLAWHLTIQTLLQASRSFIYQRAGWAGMLEQRLAASEARARELRAMEAA